MYISWPLSFCNLFYNCPISHFKNNLSSCAWPQCLPLQRHTVFPHVNVLFMYPLAGQCITFPPWSCSPWCYYKHYLLCGSAPVLKFVCRQGVFIGPRLLRLKELCLQLYQAVFPSPKSPGHLTLPQCVGAQLLPDTTTLAVLILC